MVGEEKKRRRKRIRRREEGRRKEKRKAKVWICKEFWFEFVYGSLYGFLLGFCIDTCLGVWNTSFCVESLFGMVIWVGCGPQWRKNLYRENVGF